MDGTQEFGARLRAYRYAVGLSQEELAEKSGLTAKTIGNLERGRARWPHPSSVARLADALGLDGPQRDEFTATPGRRLARPDPQVTPSQQPIATSHPGPVGFRHGLPPDTAAFTGRDTELELITGAARAGAAQAGAAQAGAAGEPAEVAGEPGGVVAIRAIGGMPGVGKTALAVRAAHLLAGAFPDRQLFIDLHGHTPGREPVSPEDALAGLLAAVGVEPRFLPTDLAGRGMLWRDRMAGQRALLVLDNAASSAQVVPLLPGNGGCLVLVTSRRHLADLPGMVVPVSVDTLPPGQARAMFIRLTPRAADEDQVPIDELAELAGHLPLAVSLLARVHARHPSWTLADLIAETRGSLLTLTAEHASVAAAFDVSWRHLDPGPQRFLAHLGLHPGTSIDRHAAAALAGVQVTQAARSLDELHREGLLTETGYRRYRMHDLIRSYAATQAGTAMTSAERDQALGRLFDYYTSAAARADLVLGHHAGPAPAATQTAAQAATQEATQPADQDATQAATQDATQAADQDATRAAGPQLPELAGPDAALAWARAEHANLLACLDHATAAGGAARVVALTAALAGLLRLDGPWSEAMDRHRVAAEAARSLGDRSGLARALLHLGTVRRLTGDFQGAADALDQALNLHRDLADPSGLAAVLLESGHVRSLTDEYQLGTEAVERALAVYRDTGDASGQAQALVMLGSLRRLTDDTEGATSVLSQALDICRDLGDRAGQADALRQLGDTSRVAGDYHAAAAHLEVALGLYRDLDDRHGQANALTWLGGVRQLTGDYPGAIADLEQALDIQRELDTRIGQGNALVLLGDVRRETGDFQAAARDLEQALGIYRDLGVPGGQAQVLGALGALRRETGDYEAAASDLAAAVSLSREIGDRGGEATGLNLLGELCRARGDADRARDCHQQALDLARQVCSRWDEAHALAGLGRCARAAGDIPAAIGLLGQAHAIFRQNGSAETAGLADELAAISENDLPPEC